MTPDPAVPIADGSLSLGPLVDPVLVDPEPALLAAVVEAYRESYPDLVDPDLDALRAAADREANDATRFGGAIGPTPPTLTVLAAESVVDAVTDGFHAASQFAALTESGAVELLTLSTPQPNAVLAAENAGCVLVEGVDGPTAEDASAGDGSTAKDALSEDRSTIKEAPATGDASTGDEPASGEGSKPGDGTERGGTGRFRHRVGDDPTLRELYAEPIATASTRRLRTPSRHRVYRAFDDRCGGGFADDVVRVLDVDPSLSSEDLVDARIRAYAVGARHELLDHDLRRACEDAGIGSSSTFTRVKRRLIDAGLVGTERVPQPVGRPRERVVAEPDLADPPLSAVGETIRAALENGT